MAGFEVLDASRGIPGTYDLHPVTGINLGVAPFWAHLRDSPLNEQFVKALDWVGVDAYPGTVFPPAHTPG